MKNVILKWYPIILAFICLLYSVGLGVMGVLEEVEEVGQEFIDKAQYSAHWPGTILLFAIAIRQRRTT
tara:strand:+ start:942 stop:1145 length:204 start_codon:yes stop_codon:yes gene_type:complete